MANRIKQLLFGLVFGLLLTAPLAAQQSSNDMVVGTVGDDEISYAELKANYTTNGAAELTLENLEEFLPVYLNYRAKLKSARENGYYTDPAILSEYQQYAKQAAYAYWLEKEIRDEMFEQYYERTSHEFKAFHVLIEAGQNISEEQEKVIFTKLKEARKRIENGDNLEDINRQFSSIQNGRSMGGTLPWFSAGRTVKPFEDAVYNLEIGETSEPVRTQFGYHIITLLDKRERSSSRKVRHIFVRPATDSSDVKTINEAYTALESGSSWADVVRDYSMDIQSKRNSGLLGWMNYGSNVPEEILDIVMNADPSLPYTEPKNTSYGFHIFRIDSVEQWESEEARRQQLMEELENTPYFQRNNSFVVDYLQNEKGFKVNTQNRQAFADFLSEQDSTLLEEIKLRSGLANRPLFSFDNQNYTAEDYLSYLVETRADRKASQYNPDWFNDFITYVVDNQMVELTVEEFPEFQQQTTNYLDGLIIYQINDDSVWSSATVDTTRLRAMYEQNRDDYTYAKRPFYYLFTSSADSTLQNARTFIENGNSPDSVRSAIGRISMTSDSTNSYQNEPFSRLSGMSEQSFSEIFEYNNRKALFYLQEWLEPRAMTFEEAFNRLLSEYQPVREEEWLEYLNETYEVEPDFEALERAYNNDSGTN